MVLFVKLSKVSHIMLAYSLLYKLEDSILVLPLMIMNLILFKRSKREKWIG